MKMKKQTAAILITSMSIATLSCMFVQSLIAPPTPTPTTTVTVTATVKPAIKPTSTPAPTSTPVPISTLQTFIIEDKSFQQYEQSCKTDIDITSVNGDNLGIEVNTTITMLNNGWALFCPGAKHTWIGTLTYSGYTFASDEKDPLRFTVDASQRYVYIGGKGSVTSPDGTVTKLSGGESGAAPSSPSALTVTGCMSSDECPGTTHIKDLFGNAELKYNTEYKASISADQNLRFYYGWCTTDDPTLEQNLTKIKYVFTIDGVSYVDNLKTGYYAQSDSNNVPMSCYGEGGAISGWEKGKTYRVVFGTIFEEDIFDGWDLYPASENLGIYSITVK